MGRDPRRDRARAPARLALIHFGVVETSPTTAATASTPPPLGGERRATARSEDEFDARGDAPPTARARTTTFPPFEPRSRPRALRRTARSRRAWSARGPRPSSPAGHASHRRRLKRTPSSASRTTISTSSAAPHAADPPVRGERDREGDRAAPSPPASTTSDTARRPRRSGFRRARTPRRSTAASARRSATGRAPGRASGSLGEDPRQRRRRREHQRREAKPSADRQRDHPRARGEGAVRPPAPSIRPTITWPAIAIASSTSARKIQSWNAIWCAPIAASPKRAATAPATTNEP